MTLSTKDLHALLLNVIKSEIEKKQAIRAREEEKSRKEIDRLNEILDKLKDFEERHAEELDSIFPDFAHHDYGFLSIATNEIYTRIDFYKDPERCMGQYRNQIEDEEQKYFYGPPDTALLTYQDFHIDTNLNIESIKKYLSEMIQMGLIQKIRVIGGYEYKILGGSNNG
jgi:hypothetical protein